MGAVTDASAVMRVSYQGVAAELQTIDPMGVAGQHLGGYVLLGLAESLHDPRTCALEFLFSSLCCECRSSFVPRCRRRSARAPHRGWHWFRRRLRHRPPTAPSPGPTPAAMRRNQGLRGLGVGGACMYPDFVVVGARGDGQTVGLYACDLSRTGDGGCAALTAPPVSLYEASPPVDPAPLQLHTTHTHTPASDLEFAPEGDQSFWADLAPARLDAFIWIAPAFGLLEDGIAPTQQTQTLHTSTRTTSTIMIVNNDCDRCRRKGGKVPARGGRRGRSRERT